MRSFRRVTTRVAPVLASVASVLLFATCDFDKISGTPAPLSQTDIDRLFSITPSDTTIILGGTTTLNITPGTGVDLSGIAKEWTSSAPTTISINSTTGVATGVAIGNATIKARILAPELDTGYSRTRSLRVRYKAIKACGAVPTLCSPAALDSIAGLNLSRPVNFFGTNNSDQLQATALTGVTLAAHDSGSTASTVTSLTSNNVFARKNGVAYVVGVFESMRDSIKVKVRQVAKSLTFPTLEYTANAVNANRQHAVTIRDVNDSVMTASPRLRWRSSDTTVVTIDSMTGVLRVKKKDTASIYVSVDTILNRRQKLVVRQVTASLTKFTTDPRNDTVARTTTVLPVVTALDSGSTPVVGDTITFRSGTGRSVITDSVRITDADGRATLGSWKIGDTVGTYTVIASSRFATTTFTTTAVPQRAFGLRFTSQATDTAANASLSTVRVSVVDSLGNLVPTATNSVTIALANNPGSATLNGTKTIAAVNGVATFTGLSLTAVGSGYTMTATGTGLSNAISDAFSIYGAPAKLAFVQQPTNVTVVNSITPAIKVAIQDANGTLVKSSTATVSITLSSNPGGAFMSGVTAVAAVGGIATFPNISLNSVANGYTIQAQSAGLTSTISNSFNVRAVGSAARLAFVQQPPASVVSGAVISPSVTVEILDVEGARVTTSSASVTLSFANNAGSGTLSSSSTLTQNAVSGLVTFPGVSVDKAAAGYTLRAFSSGLQSVTSGAFTVTPGTVSKLGFITQPTHTNPSVVISPAVQVAAQDAAGNTVPTASAYTVTLTASSGTLGGTAARAMVNGVATFDNLSFAATASGVTLGAAASGATPSLTAATSTPFAIVAASGGAIKLRWFTSPSNTSAGSTLSNVVVDVVDANNNRVTTATPSITLAIASGPGTFSASTTTLTASSGVATFTNVQLPTAGAYTLSASATGYAAVTSNSFVISAAAASTIGFVVQPPSTATAGAPFSPAIQVAVRDGFGNTVPTATNSITLSFSTFPASGTLSGTATKSAVNGIATFDNLSANTAGTYRFQAASTCCSAVFSDFFTVAAGTPTALAFEVQPTSVVAGAAITPPVKVRLQDAAGNVVSSATNPVTLALSGGDATATLGGTKTQTPSGGVVTFSDLTVDKIATGYRLNASAAGFATISSNTFNAGVGTATKLVWTVQPVDKNGGEGQTIKVSITDAQGNVVTNDTRFVGLGIFSGTGTSGAVISGDGNVQAINGVATFNNVAIDKAGTGYQLFASASGLTGAASSAFNITIGAASKLTFKVQPSTSTAATVINPAVEVAVTDAGGNVITSATDVITISKTSGSGHFQGVLSGTLSKPAVNGVAVFNDLAFDRSNCCYRLTAVAGSLAGAESNGFQVNAGPATKMVITSQPGSVVSNTAFTILAAITDAGGNNVGQISSVTIAIAPGTGTAGALLTGTTTAATNSNGDITFNDLKIDKSGTGYQLRVTSGTLTAGLTTSITVTPGTATQIVWGQQPANTFLNAPLGASGAQPTLIFKDAQGNTVDETTFPNNNNRVRVTIASGPQSTFKSGATDFTVDAVSGVATIPATVMMGATGTYTLAVTEDNCCNSTTITAPPNSASFTVSAFDVANKLGFKTQPQDATYRVNFATAPQVEIQDRYGNAVTTASNNVTIGIGTDANPTTTLSGIATVAATSGIATFAELNLNKSGTGYTLSATATGLTSATSSPFIVTTPGLVTTGGTFVNDMVRLGDTVYFTQGAALKKVHRNGGTVATITSSGSGYYGRIVTDGTNIYYQEIGSTNVNDARIKKLTISTGAVVDLTTANTNLRSEANTLGTDGTNVYFVARNGAASGLAIRSISVSAVAGSPVDIQGAHASTPHFLVSGGFIYFYNNTANSISRMTTAGASLTTLVSSANSSVFALDGTTLYYNDGTNGIRSIASANTIVAPTTPTTRVAGAFTTYAMAIADGSMYVNLGNTVRRYSLSNFASTSDLSTSAFNAGTTMPWGFTFDTTDLYFNDTSGRIAKTAK